MKKVYSDDDFVAMIGVGIDRHSGGEEAKRDILVLMAVMMMLIDYNLVFGVIVI